MRALKCKPSVDGTSKMDPESCWIQITAHVESSIVSTGSRGSTGRRSSTGSTGSRGSTGRRSSTGSRGRTVNCGIE